MSSLSLADNTRPPTPPTHLLSTIRSWSVSKGPLRLYHLPDSLFAIIGRYIANDDYHFLMNTSKREFQYIKKHTLYLSLTPQSTIRFIEDLIFRSHIYSIINNPLKQISLRFPYRCKTTLPKDIIVHRLICGLGNTFNLFEQFHNIECVIGLTYLTNVQTFPTLPNLKKIYLSYFNSLSNINHLQSLNTLSLTSCHAIEDITYLQNIPELMINNCSNIKDFTCLGKQIKLTLASCQYLKNVNHLSKVKYLTIENCENVVDITALKGIYELNLIYCSQISDVSCLGNHYKLQINECCYTLIGYNIAFSNVKHVWLNHCNITDVSILSHALSVNLVKCNDLIDISPLKNVKRVTIVSCQQITDITPLSYVKKLYLGPLPNVKDLSTLRNQFTISLTDMDNSDNNNNNNNMNHYDFIQYIPKVYIYNSKNFYNTLMNYSSLNNNNHHYCLLLKNVQLLHLQNCSNMIDISLLGAIPTLYIISCDDLVDISGLGKGNRYVKIVLCSKIKDVSSLCNVPRVTIVKCANIQNLSVLANVPRLKVTLL
eukprot:gene6791-7317_t